MTVIVLPEQRPAGRRGFDVVLSSAVTGGAAGLVEARVPAAMAGPPLHIHPASDESYFVLSGALLMYVDGEVTELVKGGLAHISRGTKHTWATTPGREAHFLMLHVPGGYEEYHPTALRVEQQRGGPLTSADLFDLAQRFDWELADPEPLRLLPTGTLVEASRADAEASRIDLRTRQ